VNTVIHWFRRDLRLTDNTALRAAAATGSAVVPVYLLSSWKGRHGWTGSARQQFLCGSLDSLARNLDSIGGRLIVREGEAQSTLQDLAAETGASAIYTNRDPDPFGAETEQKLAAALAGRGVEFRVFKDHALHEQAEVLKDDGSPYRVFTPYARAWARLGKTPAAGKPRALRTPMSIPSLPLPTPAHWGLEPFAGALEAGERAARRRMEKFLAGPVLEYADRRNIPAGTTTSRLSQDLRFGLLSIRELYARCISLARETPARERRGIETFINELVWREFYFQILHHAPEVLDVEFNPKLRGLGWHEPGEAFERWRAGETGFPIVDAAMRQLLATGFMHNRTRMITAMFLTKDLHVDWRQGERWFMQRLVDGEIASNNGGWQWSAGTGADAAPYFRIQNPWSQSARFDPDGAYIREWVPELRDVPATRLHASPPPGQRLVPGYPPPMLDHAREREVTLAMFRADERTAPVAPPS
jgi:deoxyribodipyrimidine photo-lyase